MLCFPPPPPEPCLGVCVILELLYQVTPTLPSSPPSSPPPRAATLGSACSICANAFIRVMNIHPQRGKFTKGPGEFFFASLQQVAPLTPCSQLHGAEGRIRSSAATNSSGMLIQVLFSPLLPKPSVLKAYLSGLPFYLFLLVILHLEAVICPSVAIIIFTAIMFDAA